MERVEVIDWGRLGYREAHERQLERVEQRKVDAVGDALLFVEHPHVITLGRSRAALANVLAADDVEVVAVERGGDVTYHGPGQIVVYPILKLGDGEQDLHGFLRNLEQAMIDTVGAFGIEGGREQGKTGVWTASDEARKLASIGIACRRWVTFHGLALNVNTDLSYFARINPCGFESGVMTSMAAELGSDVDIESVKQRLAADLAHRLNRAQA